MSYIKRKSLYKRDPHRQLMMDLDLRVAKGTAQGKCWGCCSKNEEDRAWAFVQVVKVNGLSKHCDKRWMEALCRHCKGELRVVIQAEQVELAAQLLREQP